MQNLSYISGIYVEHAKFVLYIRNGYKTHKKSALSLCVNYRTYSDMVTVFKSLLNGMAADFRLSFTTSNTRGGGVRQQQRCPKSRVAAQLFCCRVPTVWNKLSLIIV